MTRAGTFELRVLCDALPVCWRAMQNHRRFTFPPRSILSMDGLKDVKTGDIVRLTLRTVDKYANLRLSGGDTVQVVLQGPNGALARQVSDRSSRRHVRVGIPGHGRGTVDSQHANQQRPSHGWRHIFRRRVWYAHREEAVLVFDPPLPANASMEVTSERFTSVRIGLGDEQPRHDWIGGGER